MKRGCAEGMGGEAVVRGNVDELHLSVAHDLEIRNVLDHLALDLE